MPRPATLTPELLNTFVTLVRLNGNAGAACRELGINQPSMSKRLAYFQHAGSLIRRPWVVRRGKTWLMTDEGARVLPIVQDLLRRYDLMLDYVSRASTLSGLSFACGREAYSRYVERTLFRYLAQVGNERSYQISVETRGEARITGVASGLLGMALVTHDPEQIEKIADHRPLYIEKIDEEPLALACARESRWADSFHLWREGRVSAKMIASVPLVLPDPDSGLRRQFEERLRIAGVDSGLQIAVQGGGWDVILEAVRSGQGIGLLPRTKAESAGLLTRAPLPSLLPCNATYLIARKCPGSEDPELTEPDRRFLVLLRDEVTRFHRESATFSPPTATKPAHHLTPRPQ